MAIKITIKGKVHNVGYRLLLLNEADDLLIRKFDAKNVKIGNKEALVVLADGTEEQTKKFIEFVKKNEPSNATVESIEIEECPEEVKSIETFRSSFNTEQLFKIVQVELLMANGIDNLNTKMDDLNIKVGSLNNKMSDLNAKMSDPNIKVDSLNTKMDDLNIKTEGLSSKMGNLSVKVDNLNSKMGQMVQKQDETINETKNIGKVCRERIREDKDYNQRRIRKNKTNNKKRG